MADLIPAASIELQTCDPDCPCQSVHLLMLDPDGDAFASGSMPPAAARKLAEEILKTADLAEARQARVSGRQL